jgi:hypothetical protein
MPGNQQGQDQSPNKPNVLAVILASCESNLFVVVLIVLVSFVCLAGIFNRPGKPLTIELGFPASSPLATPAPPIHKYSLARVANGELLIMTNDAAQSQPPELYSVAGGQVTAWQAVAGRAITDTRPAFSENRANVAFVSEQDGFNQVYVVISGTTGVQTVPLTETRQVFSIFGGAGWNGITGTLKIPANTPLSWSPDGQHLAFIAEGKTASSQPLSAVYALTATQPLTPTQLEAIHGSIYSPVWVDDEWLAYVRGETNQVEQVVLHSSLTGARQVIYPRGLPTPTLTPMPAVTPAATPAPATAPALTPVPTPTP